VLRIRRTVGRVYKHALYQDTQRQRDLVCTGTTSRDKLLTCTGQSHFLTDLLRTTYWQRMAEPFTTRRQKGMRSRERGTFHDNKAAKTRILVPGGRARRENARNVYGRRARGEHGLEFRCGPALERPPAGFKVMVLCWFCGRPSHSRFQRPRRSCSSHTTPQLADLEMTVPERRHLLANGRGSPRLSFPHGF
jgi:hypothetical protein